jgi:YHS domain-containing protein
MTDAPSTDKSERLLTRDILYAIRYYFGGRYILYVLAGLLILSGIALNWGWLAAAGIAPILITLLPCAVMCALGLCMAHKATGGKQASARNGASEGATMQLTATRHAHDVMADPDELFDPVSQTILPAATAIAAVHQGRIYYFETRANREAFEADPEKFLAGSQVVGQQIGSSDQRSHRAQQEHGCC